MVKLQVVNITLVEIIVALMVDKELMVNMDLMELELVLLRLSIRWLLLILLRGLT